MNLVDDYLHGLSYEKRQVLTDVRSQISTIVPSATEQISYGMPAFKYRDKYLIAYAAFKDHFSLFPGAVPESALPKLGGFELGKGTIRFYADRRVPKELLRELLEARIAEIDAVASR